jgi:hypothetical protein
MKKVELIFEIKRGEVFIHDLEDEEVKELALECHQLLWAGQRTKAMELIFSRLSFEWSWSNGDGDASEYFENIEDIFFECTTQNTLLKVDRKENKLILTAQVKFELEGKDNIEAEELTDWLSENSMYACGYVGVSGWSYSGSDGDNVWLSRIDGEPV